MKKYSFNEIKTKFNIKKFLKLADPGTKIKNRTCREQIFESITLASLGRILLKQIDIKERKKIYSIRELKFEDPYSFEAVFDFKTITSNFELIREINFKNKRKDIHFFLQCLYSKLNKTYYITVEEHSKAQFPGDDFFFKSKSKSECLKTLDIIKDKLFKVGHPEWKIKI